MTPKQIDDILLAAGSTGLVQGWFQRPEVIAAVKAAYELGKAEKLTEPS